MIKSMPQITEESALVELIDATVAKLKVPAGRKRDEFVRAEENGYDIVAHELKAAIAAMSTSSPVKPEGVYRLDAQEREALSDALRLSVTSIRPIKPVEQSEEADRLAKYGDPHAGIIAAALTPPPVTASGNGVREAIAAVERDISCHDCPDDIFVTVSNPALQVLITAINEGQSLATQEGVTEEMIEAGRAEWHYGSEPTNQHLVNIYLAMREAALRAPPADSVKDNHHEG